MPEPIVLRDRTMSCDTVSVEFDIHQGHSYRIGRKPGAPDDPKSIYILQGYKRQRGINERLEELGRSVSDLQATVINVGGILHITAKSTKSPTYAIPSDRIPKGKVKLSELEVFRLTPEDETPLFQGYRIVFGSGYQFEVLGKKDSTRERQAEAELRNDDTQVIPVKDILRR